MVTIGKWEKMTFDGTRWQGPRGNELDANARVYCLMYKILR